MVDSMVLDRISNLLNAVKPVHPFDQLSNGGSINENEILIHCVRLAHSQLGIDVTGLDLKGELDSNKFKYLKKELVKGGCTNILYKVTNSKNNKTVAVRIFGRKTERFIDRSHERIIQTHLCIQGFAKHVYARFNGGQVEEWLQGEVLSDEEFRTCKYSHLIAKQLRVLHNIPGQRELYLALYPELRNGGEVVPESQLWRGMWKFYNLCLENASLVAPIIGSEYDLLDIRQLIKKLKHVCDSKESPIVLCHCDLLSGNVLVNKDKASFLDYEYSCFMERGFDIANHFIEFCGIECNWECLPSEEEQRRFLKHYVGENANQEDVDILHAEIQPFFMASNLFWGLWGLLQSIFSTHDIDFTHYARSRISRAFNDEKWTLFE
ncbi:choline ethanolamine [Babesia ovis]|uniref:ethanolamine kinase n=1 Tax=Babesia ovis TaxID=5869 RepID=A0A9W5TAP3_BABOV|nr:choline ethanolamine [Babesia ovis]